MSLINEALKKAQRQRNIEGTPVSSVPGDIGAAVTTHGRTASRSGSKSPLWLGIGLLFLGAGVAAVVFIFFLKPAASPAAAPVLASAARPTPYQVVKPQAKPVPAAPSPVPTVPPVTQPKPEAPPATMATTPVVTPTPVKPAPVPTLTPIVSLPAAATPVPAPAPIIAPLSPAPVPVVQAAITQEARVYAVLDSLRITGVRGLGLEARVLMNEKIYRINDLVDRDLGLRLREVLPGLLVFTDASGGTYKKPL